MSKPRPARHFYCEDHLGDAYDMLTVEGDAEQAVRWFSMKHHVKMWRVQVQEVFFPGQRVEVPRRGNAP